MPTIISEWIICPVCGSKTRDRIREDTELKHYPLYCPKCKQETLINAKELHITVIKEPDAQTQSRWTCEQSQFVGSFLFKIIHISPPYKKRSFDGLYSYALSLPLNSVFWIDVGDHIGETIAEEQPIEVGTVADMLDEIENERLYQILVTVDKRTLQIVLLKIQGYSTKEIAPLVGLTTGAIYARLDHLQKKLKQFKA